MGRLFWKFFLFIWLAQLFGIIATGSTFWLSQQHDRRFGVAPPPLAGPPLAGPPLAGPPLGGPPVGGLGGPSGAGPPGGGPGAPPGERGAPPGGGPPPPPWRDFHGGPGMAMVATLLASLLTAALLAWYMAKPIRSLRWAFDQVSSGRLDYRVAPLIGARKDELADLGREFDRMTERLQDSMDRQRRLLHDVSHEVRSPLARLQAAAGLLRQQQSTERPTTATTVDRIEEEIARIDRLVGDLLSLSRIEAGELAGAVEDVDLRELVSQVVADANFEAQGSGRVVRWTDPIAGTVRGRPEMLHVALENVVRNAIKHAPGSQVVNIEASIDARRSLYTLRVLDTGPGVPEDELPALFTPFFRATPAAATEGYGLGLAIARRSIEAHGGTIHAQNRPGGGLGVEIVLPMRDAMS